MLGDSRPPQAERPEPIVEALGVREALRGKHLLLTGFSGFLGKVTFLYLLEHVPELRCFTLLLRAKRGQSAQQRFEHIVQSSPAFRSLRARHGRRLAAFLAGRVRVLEADITRPLCGLEASFAARWLADVDGVLHIAGLTDFEPDPNLALAINVQGAEHVADLTALSRARRLIHVSTTFAAGVRTGSVTEDLMVGQAPSGGAFDPRAEFEGCLQDCAAADTRRARIAAVNERAHALGWPNIYTYTKGLAEHILQQRDDLYLTMVRPAVVEGARSFPLPGWNEGINTSGPLVWLLSSTFRRFPSRAKHLFDVIPVDTVAKSTVAIVSRHLQGLARSLYHLGSSDINPLTFGRAIDLTALAARRMHVREEASLFERLVVRRLDAVPVDADRSDWFGVGNLQRGARKARDLIRSVQLGDALPPALHRRIGPQLERRLRSTASSLKSTERRLGRVQEMLRLYRPFIHDHDWIFCTDNIRDLSNSLSLEERDLFGFDIADLDWRNYWLDVHVPGLERWCLPLLRGERIPEDWDPLLADTSTDEQTLSEEGKRRPHPALHAVASPRAEPRVALGRATHARNDDPDLTVDAVADRAVRS